MLHYNKNNIKHNLHHYTTPTTTAATIMKRKEKTKQTKMQTFNTRENIK